MAEDKMSVEVQPIVYVDDGRGNSAVSTDITDATKRAAEARKSLGIQNPEDYESLLVRSGVSQPDIERLTKIERLRSALGQVMSSAVDQTRSVLSPSDNPIPQPVEINERKR